MASAVLGGLFNAFAFAGAGYLVKYFDKNLYNEESNRHDLAMEKQNEENEKYLKMVTDRKNKLAELREELVEANSDIKSTNQALELVSRIQELTKKPEPRRPKLSDHYTPNPEMEEYMTLFGLLAGGAVGGAACFLL
jgi:hypothetical protein